MTDWCRRCAFMDRDGAEEPCRLCNSSFDDIPSEYKPNNNAELIRSMNDEEMANALTNMFFGMVDADASQMDFYRANILRCLKQEVL